MARDFSGSGQYLKYSGGFGLAGADPIWVAFRAWADAIPSTILFQLGVASNTNNRKAVSISSTAFSAFTVDNGGTLEIASHGSSVTTGQWYDIVAEMNGSGENAISVNGTRTSAGRFSTASVAPNELSIGISNAGAGPLDGRLAWLGLWSGIPTAENRAAARILHPTAVSPSTLIDAWDLNTSLIGYKGTTLTATGSPTVVDSPSIILPFRRKRVFVQGTAVLTSGTASGNQTGPTTASLTVGAASGGTPGYTYQWHRDTTPGFTPSGANDIVGATSLTLNDTGLTPSTTYYYKNVVSDDVLDTATSNQVTITTPASATRRRRVMAC
jgi:hypothetical protein